MPKCRLSPDPNPRTCSGSLQGVQSSEGRLALPLMLHQLLPGPQARHTDEWRRVDSSLPSQRRKSLRSQEMKGHVGQRHGVLPASVFSGRNPGSMCREVSKHNAIMRRKQQKSLSFSGHVQQSQWPPEPAFSPPFL